MKGKRFTEEQIIGVLKESEAGAATKELCRRHGISEQSFYRWKSKYGGMDVSDAKKLRALEDENRRLKHIVAEQALDIAALKGVLGKKMVTPASKRRAASVMVTDFRRSQSGSCRLVGLQRSTYRYRSRRSGDDELREKLRELAHRRPRFGYRRLGIFLRREGYRINHKKLLRLYRSEGLVLPRKRPKKRLWQRPKPLLPAVRPNERWSMDFVSDRLQSGRRLRILTIVDDYTREWKAAVVDTSIGGVRVVRLLEELAESTGLPTVIVSDNGPEFTSRAFLAWVECRGIDPRFIQPGKPTQNAIVESFNGKFREERLDTHWFTTLDDARSEIEAWRTDYNDVRPHSSLDDQTPSEFAATHQGTAA